MKCERCGKELSDSDLYCSRCGKAVFPEYMDEEDIWAYYKSDEELEQILKAEEGQEEESQEEVSEEEAGEPEVSETGTPLPEEAPIENSQPEILEAEPRELEAVRPEITAEDPETAFEPVIPEENPSEKEPENPRKLEQSEDKQAKEVLVDVYDLLDFKKDAYELLCQIGNRSDKKTLKRLGTLKEYAENWGNHYALPKPKTPEEKQKEKERQAQLGLPQPVEKPALAIRPEQVFCLKTRRQEEKAVKCQAHFRAIWTVCRHPVPDGGHSISRWPAFSDSWQQI